MAPKENLTALKTLVISMGFLLVGGTVLLAGIVWKKVSTEAAAHASASICPGGSVNLRGKGAVIESSIEGQVMRVLTEKNEQKTDVYLIDLCKGTIISRLTLETDPAPVTE